MAIDRVTTGALLDGTIATADIENLAVDTNKLANNAVTAEKMAVGAAFVTGMIMPYAGAIANQAASPNGWLLCDGSEQDASVYAALKNLLLTTYGAYTNGSGGVGTSHFILPDLRGRVIAALDNMGGGSANRITSPEGDILGNGGNTVNFGAQEHQLTAAQSGMPAHGHTDNFQASSSVDSLTIYAWSGGGGGSGSNDVSGVVGNVQNNANSVATVTGYTYTRRNLNGTISDSHHTGSVTTNLTGGVTNHSGADASAAHPLTQPTMFMNYIIKT